jgi:beta-glucosidase
MASISHLLLSGLLTVTVVNGQQYDPPARSSDAFTYVQPRDTIILGPYGHSPAVLPSRKSLINI